MFLLVAGSSIAQDSTPSDDRWRLVQDGVVLDGETGLEWTQTDNGSDLDWNGAMSHCGGLVLAEGGWRLPSIEELGGLSHEELAGRVPSVFRLSEWEFWSSTAVQHFFSGRGLTLNLGTGLRDAARPESRHRVLCVRNSAD